MSNFRTINRDTAFLLPPSVDEWMPDRHLARFVVEVIAGLGLSELVKAYRGSGSASYHPAMLLGLLVYGYSTKVFSSRAIERATHDSVAFRFIAGNEHPDHETIAAFRKRFLGQIEALFIDVLKLARTMGLLKLGTVALDGTKVHANASRHSALSYGHARKIEQHLKREVQRLLRLAEQADTANIPDGMSIPAELERREVRLAAIAEAKAKIEARAEERLERKQAEHQAKLAARDEQEQRTGRKPPGRPPAPPTGGALEKDQVNLTDEDSRIMKVADGGFDQCYNAQAVVATGGTRAHPADPRRQRLSQSEQRRAVHGCQDRAADRQEALSPSCQLETALCRRTEIATGIGHADAEDGASAENSAGQKARCAAQANPRTGVRHHQIRDGLSPMSVARPGKRQGRMESGHHELEHQADVRDAALLRGPRDHSTHDFRSTAT
jgi:transposase